MGWGGVPKREVSDDTPKESSGDIRQGQLGLSPNWESGPGVRAFLQEMASTSVSGKPCLPSVVWSSAHP